MSVGPARLYVFGRPGPVLRPSTSRQPHACPLLDHSYSGLALAQCLDRPLPGSQLHCSHSSQLNMQFEKEKNESLTKAQQSIQLSRGTGVYSHTHARAQQHGERNLGIEQDRTRRANTEKRRHRAAKRLSICSGAPAKADRSARRRPLPADVEGVVDLQVALPVVVEELSKQDARRPRQLSSQD
jgi:hypothetical protein